MAKKSLASALREAIEPLASAEVSPFARFRDDPEGFAEQVVGITLWEGQRQLMRAIRDHDRVAVCSGRGISKSFTFALMAWWFWCTRGPGALVMLTGSSARVAKEVLWVEVIRIHAMSRTYLGVDSVPQVPETGVRAPDGRRMVGAVADQVGGMRGIRSAEMLVLYDEASSGSDVIFDGAIIGNLSGGGRLVLGSNPTRNEGFFYRAMQEDSFYHRVWLSVLESPNIVTGKTVIPGLATRAWVQERKDAWGEESAEYQIHVLGRFPTAIEGRLFQPGAIARAEELWTQVEPTGPLFVACDPAGEGKDGDASAFAVRRGRKVLTAYTRHGLSPEAILLEIVGLIGEHRGGTWEVPRVVYDREGSVGAKLHAVVLVHHERHRTATSEPFHPIGVRSSEKPRKRINDLHSLRDELWYNLSDAFAEGLGIPTLPKLEGDLAVVRFDRLVKGKSKVIDKKIMRRELGRSPDLGDALALVCYEGPAWIAEEEKAGSPTGAGVAVEEEAPLIDDPYDLADWAQRGRR